MPMESPEEAAARAAAEASAAEAAKSEAVVEPVAEAPAPAADATDLDARFAAMRAELKQEIHDQLLPLGDAMDKFLADQTFGFNDLDKRVTALEGQPADGSQPLDASDVRHMVIQFRSLKAEWSAITAKLKHWL